MEPNTPEESREENYQFVMNKNWIMKKKRKGGKKKQNANKVNVSQGNPDDSESVSVVNIEEKEDELNLIEESADNLANEIEDIDSSSNFDDQDAGNNIDSRISQYSTVTTDAMVSAPPRIPSPENEKEKEIHKEEEEEIHYQGDEAQLLPYNTKALSKHATTYELEKFEKNALIIFNQENIDCYKKPRLGTGKDVDALMSTFKNYGFEATEHKDLTKDEVFKELKKFSEINFTDYGCVVVVVLTHGSKNGLLRAKDQPFSEIEIVNQFKVRDKPTLVTKPRVLIIQACRGTNRSQGVGVQQQARIRRDLDEEVEPYILPVEADMLVIHSSYIGSVSHRDELHGSWFIQSLCEKINLLAPTHDFESIITEMKREVAIDRQHEEYSRRTLEMETNKQMPVMTSTLIRKLYLKKFGDKTPDVIVTSAPNIEKSSSHEVLDSCPIPTTPLRVQFGPCNCFLDHFSYIRTCLRYFLEDNPNDSAARAFLDLADTFEDGVEFNATKEIMLRAICNHLVTNSKDCRFVKFVHFYKP